MTSTSELYPHSANHRQGFVIYGFVLAIALASLIAILFGIHSRAKELLYYKELAKQRTVGYGGQAYCGGAQKRECPEGFTCDLTNPSDDGYGTCEVGN